MMDTDATLHWLGFLHALFPLYGVVCGVCCYLAAVIVWAKRLSDALRRSVAGGFLSMVLGWGVASVVLTDATVDRLMSAQLGQLPDYSKQERMLSRTVKGKRLRPEAYRSGEWWASVLCALHVGTVPLLMLVVPTRRRAGKRPSASGPV